MLPSKFCELDINEKAFVIAAIDIKVAEERKSAKQLDNSAKGR